MSEYSRSMNTRSVQYRRTARPPMSRTWMPNRRASSISAIASAICRSAGLSGGSSTSVADLSSAPLTLDCEVRRRSSRGSWMASRIGRAMYARGQRRAASSSSMPHSCSSRTALRAVALLTPSVICASGTVTNGVRKRSSTSSRAWPDTFQRYCSRRAMSARA